MDPALAPPAAPAPATFEDGLGERYKVVDRARNEPVEVFRLRSELTSVPAFEFALRERVSRLAAFRHPCYAHVRSVERLKDPSSTLALVSDVTAGVRLSELLVFAERAHVTLDIDAALCLLRQLVPAVALLHEIGPEITHGGLAAERIMVTPGARIIIVEHVMGSAIEQLRFTRERYWKDLRIALPQGSGVPKFDHRADVTQLGAVALSLILGRPLLDDESPSRLGNVVASTWAVSARGGLEPLPAGLRGWLTSALQLDPRNSFASAIDAQGELERVLGENDYLAAPATLESFLAQYHATLEPVTPPAVQQPRLVAPPSPVVLVNPVPVPAPVPVPLPVPVPVAVVSHVAAAAPTASSSSFGAVRPLALPTPLPPPVVKLQDAPKHVSFRPAPLDASPIQKDDDDAATAREPRKGWQLAAAAIVLISLAGAGVAAARRYVAPRPATHEGMLTVSTNPPGARLFVDGVERGVSPATVTLNVGPHSLELRGDGDPRLVSITMTAGAQMSQYIDLPKTAATLGHLQVRTEPAGVRVSVDGIPRGTSPVVIGELLPGEHAVLVESDHGPVKQTVTIEAGITASLMVPLGAPEGAPVSGWLAVSAPADVQVFENTRLLGTSQSDRLMVSAGRHEIEIVNETLGYRAKRTVQVAPGKVSPIKIEFPKGTIALNAVPWAEVWVDGDKIGDTPIGNLQLTIGPHEIVFRHPDLGEQRHAAMITLTSPARLSVDLRKK
jgi:serine/threonine protein kinase